MCLCIIMNGTKRIYLCKCACVRSIIVQGYLAFKHVSAFDFQWKPTNTYTY